MITPSKEFWKVFKETEGALSCTEAVAIMNIAALAPEGTYIELGSYKLKSAMSAIMELKDGDFYAVDPEFLNEKFLNETTKNVIFRMNVIYVGGYSTDIIPHHAPYSYVFVDSGSHQDGLPMQEVKLLGDRMVQGGIIAFHDFRSQFVEVEGAYNYLLSTGKYEEIIIDWQPIIEYVNENNLEEGNVSWHHTELKNPCFVGALKRK